MYTPLAARMRPETLDDYVGQEHLVGKGRALRNIIESGVIPNMIFYGSPGIGKTTLAYMIANQTNKTLYKMNATTASTGDIKDIIAQLDTLYGENGIILYLDEIQYFNKKQQQIFLEFIENGRITLIASTSENPYFYVYSAILSRCTVFEFKPLSTDDVAKALRRAMSLVSTDTLTVEAETGAIEQMALASNGDLRKAINMLEVLTLPKVGQTKIVLTPEKVREVSFGTGMRYDKDGDAHYDILSAFQKSIRGSDPDAAVHYLARLVEAGDLPSICRRLLVIAAEDIGLAYPQAIVVTKACVDAAFQLGFPEAQIPLSEAVILLATAPKSNSAVNAVGAALSTIREGRAGDIPAHLKDAHYGGAQKLGHGLTYQYPHSFPNHYVKQQYLPDEIKDERYYEYGDNKTEQAAKAYWEAIKHEKK